MKICKRLRRVRNASGLEYCEICKAQTILHEHHLSGHNIDKSNESFNLTNLCPTCHTLVHEGQIIIVGWVSSTDGRILMWHKKGENPFNDEPATPHIINRNR